MMRRAMVPAVLLLVAGGTAPVPQNTHDPCRGVDLRTCLSRTTTGWDEWRDEHVYQWMYRVKHAQWSQSASCDTIKNAAFEILANWQDNPSASPPEYLIWADMRNKRELGFHSVFYDANDTTVVNEHALVLSRDSTLADTVVWKTFLHEAAHHAGWSSESDADRAMQCAPLPPDPPDLGIGGGPASWTVTSENWDCWWEKQIFCKTTTSGIECEYRWVFLRCEKTL